jgi:hypothetical protein
MPERVGDNTSGTPGPRPVVEDALRALSSLQELAKGWAERNLGESNGAHPGSDCQWCPLCQFAAVLRGERPELTERVVEAGTAIATALRVFAEAASGTAGPPSPHRDPRASDAPRVQKINLGDEA